MSCAYRHAATRIAAMAGIPLNLMLTAMDIARQRRVTFPALPPNRLRTIAPVLGITPTCGNPQQVIARIQSALIALGTLHPRHPCIERWMAVAAALGVPDDHLPVPVHPEIMATVRAQWAAPPPNPAPDRATAGIAALWQGNPIPTELIEEAIRTGDRTAIVTWMAYGVWDDRFEAVCQKLTDEEIGTIVRAGVVPDALVEQVAQRLWSEVIPWEVFPLTLWDRVDDPDIARKGRARTAAAKLIRDPALRDDQIIAAAAEESWCAGNVLIARHDLRDDRLIAAVATDPWSAHDVLCARHDLRDDRLIAAVADGDPWYVKNLLLARPDLRTETCLIEVAADPDWWAYDVLIKHPDQYTDERLITVAAQQPSSARDVLLARHDLRDDRLIAAVAEDPQCAHEVLVARHDLSDDRLIAAVADATDIPWLAQDVLTKRRDLRDDRLIKAVATPWDAYYVLTHCHDLRDDRLIAAVATDVEYAHNVLCARHDLRDDRLIAAAAEKPWCAGNVLVARPDLRTDARLLTAIARDRALVDSVLTQVPELRDHPILAAVRHADGSSG